MKRVKLKLVYWLMKSMNIRFMAIEMNDRTEELAIHSNMDIMEFNVIMGMIQELQNKKNK